MHRFMRAYPNTTIQHRLHGGNDSSSNCGIPPDNSLHFIRSADDSRLPWPGVFVGLTIASIWYWCTDQVLPRFSPVSHIRFSPTPTDSVVSRRQSIHIG